jgi:mannose-6-phosphate isomerase-like protein (cupin superfamily)
MTPLTVKLSEAHLHLQLHGPSGFLPMQFGSVEHRGGNVILWDPGVPGLVGGEGEMSADSDHDGERHLDGDELLYLISGAMRLLLEFEDGSTSEVPLRAGEALLVPRGVWHRLLPSEPSRLLFFGGGRTEVRLRGGG